MVGFTRGATTVVAAVGLTFAVAAAAEAGECVKKGAIGSAGSEYDAKIQVDEALLQAVSWTDAWWPWMQSDAKAGEPAVLPLYTFGRRSYRCKQGGSWGWTCQGQAVICKR